MIIKIILMLIFFTVLLPIIPVIFSSILSDNKPFEYLEGYCDFYKIEYTKDSNGKVIVTKDTQERVEKFWRNNYTYVP